MGKKKKGPRVSRKVPKVNRFGFVIIGGYRWGTAAALAQMLKVARSTVERRLTRATSHFGLDPRGRWVRLYSERAARGADARQQPPRANAEGFFERNGEIWAAPEVIARKLSAQEKLLKRHAADLARVLRALRQRKPDVTSSALWKAVLKQFDEVTLVKALQAFHADGNLDAFLRILP